MRMALRLIDLNAQFPVGGTVREELGGVALLKGVWTYVSLVLGIKVSKALNKITCSLCLLSVDQDASKLSATVPALHLPACHSLP